METTLIDNDTTDLLAAGATAKKLAAATTAAARAGAAAWASLGRGLPRPTSLMKIDGLYHYR